MREAMARHDDLDDVADLQALIDKWIADDKGVPVDEAFNTVRRTMNDQ